MCIVHTLKVMPHPPIDSWSFSVCFVSSLLILESAVAAVTMFLIRTSLMRSSKWSSSTITCTKNVESYCFGFLYLQSMWIFMSGWWMTPYAPLLACSQIVSSVLLSCNCICVIPNNNVMTIVYVCGMNFIIPFVFLNITIQTSVIWICYIETHL